MLHFQFFYCKSVCVISTSALVACSNTKCLERRSTPFVQRARCFCFSFVYWLPLQLYIICNKHLRPTVQFASLSATDSEAEWDGKERVTFTVTCLLIILLLTPPPKVRLSVLCLCVIFLLCARRHIICECQLVVLLFEIFLTTSIWTEITG